MSELESAFQQDARLWLGSRPDLVVFRNNVGQARETDDEGNVIRRVRYGLMDGSADVIGILGPLGRFFSLELKKQGGKTNKERLEKQRLWRELVRKFGGFADVADCIEDVEAAYVYAKLGMDRIPLDYRKRVLPGL